MYEKCEKTVSNIELIPDKSKDWFKNISEKPEENAGNN